MRRVYQIGYTWTTLAACAGSRRRYAEILALRHQILVLRPQRERPRLTPIDGTVALTDRVLLGEGVEMNRHRVVSPLSPRSAFAGSASLPRSLCSRFVGICDTGFPTAMSRNSWSSGASTLVTAPCVDGASPSRPVGARYSAVTVTRHNALSPTGLRGTSTSDRDRGLLQSHHGTSPSVAPTLLSVSEGRV